MQKTLEILSNLHYQYYYLQEGARVLIVYPLSQTPASFPYNCCR